jgi:hypothetical protein
MGYLPYNLYEKAIPWIIVMFYCGIMGTVFLIKTMRASKEVKFQKNMYRTISVILYLYISIRIFFLFSDIERDNFGDSFLYDQFVAIAYIITGVAFLNIIYFLESSVLRKTKHAISYAIIILIIVDVLIVSIFTDYIKLLRYFNYGLAYSEIVIILAIYLYLTVKSTGKLRTNSALTLLGLAIAGAASFLEMDAILMSGNIPAFISPITFAVGITIFSYSYIRTI